MRRGERKTRVLLLKQDYDPCKTCRKRKVKCDGQRPLCQKCSASGRYCGGYATWEVRVQPSQDILPLVSKTLPVSQGALSRLQLLSGYLESKLPNYLGSGLPGPRPAGSPIGHSQFTSLPHIWATVDEQSPLVNHAIETICLTHLASKHDDLWHTNVALKSRGQLMNALQDAIHSYHSNQLVSRPREIVTAVMLASLAPPLKDDPKIMRQQSLIHIKGALEFVANIGPSMFTQRGPLGELLLRQLHQQAFFIGLSRRKKTLFLRPEWSRVPDLLLPEEKHLFGESSEVSHGIVVAEPSFSQQLRQSPGRTTRDINLIRDLLVPLPGLLEITDAFVEGSKVDSGQMLSEMSDLVKAFNDSQVSIVQPVLDNDITKRKPSIDTSNTDELERQNEIHRFLLSSGMFMEQYQFSSTSQGHTSVTSRFHSLYTDCTLLHIVHAGIKRYGLPAGWTGIPISQIERRAYSTAGEMCRHVFAYSQRSMSATKYIFALLTGARNFFESYEATDEMSWCEECLTAISARIESLKSESSSICPMINLIPKIADGLRYGWVGDFVRVRRHTTSATSVAPYHASIAINNW